MFSKYFRSDFAMVSLFLLKIFLFWVIVFQVQRQVFLLSNLDFFSFSSLQEFAKIIWSSVMLDFSFAGYLTASATLLYLALYLAIPRYSVKIVQIYCAVIIVVLCFLATADLALYSHWNYRINSTAYSYFETPALIFASSSGWSFFFYIMMAVVMSVIFIRFFYKYCMGVEYKVRSWSVIGALLIIIVIMPIVMRGGFQTIPINVSAAYHSSKAVNNHAAINPFWNLMHSAMKNSKSNKPYDLLPKADVEITLKRGLPEIHTKLDLKSDPNIIILVWESLTAKITADYNNTETVPRLEALKSEGIYFDNFYANGTRSDKGLVSIFSGYYPQAMHSIMKETQKARSLPTLYRSLKQKGYKSSFYYGGDMNFGSMNSYFIEGGVDEIIDDASFLEADKNTKWGAYDHVVLERMLSDIEKEEHKFCKVLFTITSHEPFEIPIDYKFGDSSDLDRFKSAHYYTDSAINDFVQHAKKQSWWDDTLLIILADHGHVLPRIEDHYMASDRFRVPMLWLGGALSTVDTVVSKVCSQVDFSKSLLLQLGIEATEFEFSRDIFDVNNLGIAHYIYPNGFGTVSAEGAIVYDLDQYKITLEQGTSTEVARLQRMGKAITQDAYDDYLSR